VSTSETAIPITTYDIEPVFAYNEGEQLYNFASAYRAKDPLAMGLAPSISFKNYYQITKSSEKLVISGRVNGEPYPAVEAFISDEAGNSVFIGAAAYEGVYSMHMANMIRN